MNIVFDTDILSIFAKADAIQYLERLFSNDHLLITPSVYRELKVPKEYEHCPHPLCTSDPSAVHNELIGNLQLRMHKLSRLYPTLDD